MTQMGSKTDELRKVAVAIQKLTHYKQEADADKLVSALT